VYNDLSTRERSKSDENIMNGLGNQQTPDLNLDALEGFGEIIDGPRASQQISEPQKINLI